MSRLLWTYEIRALPDEPIDLNEYEGNSGRAPVPFRIQITPRHNKVRDVLDSEREN